MKFYSITASLDNKIIGIYPQVEEAVYHCDVWNDPLFIDRIGNQKISFDPKTADAILRKKAKLTDLISADLIGFSLKILISSKFKSVLESYASDYLQFFPSKVHYQGEKITDYWVSNHYQTKMQFIDFDQSEVYLTKNTFTKLEQVTIKSFEEFTEIKRKVAERGYPYGLRIEKFKIHSDTKENLFVVQDVEGGIKYIVSQALKDYIEDAGCTGIEFIPCEVSLNDWLMLEREKIYGKV